MKLSSVTHDREKAALYKKMLLLKKGKTTEQKLKQGHEMLKKNMSNVLLSKFKSKQNPIDSQMSILEDTDNQLKSHSSRRKTAYVSKMAELRKLNEEQELMQ